MKFDDRLCESLNQIVGDFDVAHESERFLNMMQDDHPDELDEWVAASTRRFIANAMKSKLGADRRRSRTQASAKQFSETDIDEIVDSFSVTYVIGSEKIRRRVGDMNGADHIFVADSYDHDAAPLLMAAAFHRAVAKKAGKRRTADVMTVEQYDELWRSINAQRPAA